MRKGFVNLLLGDEVDDVDDGDEDDDDDDGTFSEDVYIKGCQPAPW